jgi:uncharacterized protein YegL
MRRLPVYLLLDTSGSMAGEPIEAVKNGVQVMISSLRNDPQAVETAFLSIITFDSDAKQIVPLTDLASFQMPDIKASGTTSLGEALKVLTNCIKTEVTKTTAEVKGDWKPLLFLFTDGTPSDKQLYREMIPEIKKLNFGIIVGCAAGVISDESILRELCDSVVQIDTADASTLKQFFKWVSETIDQGNKSMGTGEKVGLPPPPSDINLVI